MKPSPISEGYQVPLYAELFYLDNMNFLKISAADLFRNKRVVVFSLVGANNRICGEEHLQDIKSAYQDLMDEGIDKVYVLTTNDVWTLNEWNSNNNFTDVGPNAQFISDGNSEFTSEMGYLVNRGVEGYGKRPWRNVIVVNNQIIEKVIVEPGMCDNCETDPYSATHPDKVLEYLRT
jgi:thioredoxin-dependent peroxiredoxin